MTQLNQDPQLKEVAQVNGAMQSFETAHRWVRFSYLCAQPQNDVTGCIVRRRGRE